MMKTVKSDAFSQFNQESINHEDQLPGYPAYPENEDIYNNNLEEKDIDPEQILKTKKFGVDFPDDDLDIPGSELDDDMENIGSEDEENNYYSIGDDQEGPDN